MNRVEKQFSLIGNQKGLLARSFSEPTMPVESDPNIPQLLRARLLVEIEPGQVSLSRHLRSLAEDGTDRNVRFEAPDDFRKVIDILVAQAIDYSEKAMSGRDVRDIASQFRTKCAELFERISRGLMVFQEQVESIDIHAMTSDEARRHFSFYSEQMSGYVLALGDLSHGRLIDALEPLAAEPLTRIFRRIIVANRDVWIDRIGYLQRLIEKSLFKLRETTANARRLRAVTAHIRRHPGFSLPMPMGETPAWMRQASPVSIRPAFDWRRQEVKDLSAPLVGCLRSNHSLGIDTRERQRGKLIEEESILETEAEPPPLLKALDEWGHQEPGAALDAIEFHRISSDLQDIPESMWLMALHERYEDDTRIEWDLQKLIPNTDDRCLVNAKFSTSAS